MRDATAVAALHQVDRIAAAFHGDLKVGDLLASTDPGKPQTVLLIGSDKRAKGARDHDAGQRSDTMILMRLDPERNAIALMSMPRDLKVRIPGHGKDKLNAAYSIGGTRLLLSTVKQVTGLRINHVINVDFRGFCDAVNAIGCVYTDVDRRYFNDNSNLSDQYATIDVDPGYQKLCGKDALDYVRYRHTDSDIVRAARQQDFLRQAKAQVGAGKLLANQTKLIKIVSKYTRSDIHGRSAVLRLLLVAVNSAGSPIREIHFPAHVGASRTTDQRDGQVKRQHAVPRRQGVGGAARRRRSREPRARRKRTHSNLVDISGGGRTQALTVAKSARGLAIYYPRLGVPKLVVPPEDPPARTRSRAAPPPLVALPAGRLHRVRSASTTGSRAPPGRTRRSSTSPTESAR